MEVLLVAFSESTLMPSTLLVFIVFACNTKIIVIIVIMVITSCHCFFWRSGKNFLRMFHHLLLTADKFLSPDTLPNIFVEGISVVHYICVSMTCHVLQKKMVLVKLNKHVKSCSPTTKSIIPPLPQCLWSPNLTEC